MQPYNYQIPQANLGQSILSGAKAGQEIRQINQQNQQQEEKARLAEEYKMDAREVFSNPSHEKIAGLMVKYPKMGEGLKAAHEQLREPERLREIRDTQEFYSAVSNDRPDIAIESLNQKITAFENSGQDSTKYKQIKELIEKDSNVAKVFLGSNLASMMGEKDFSKTFKALGEESRAEGEVELKQKINKQTLETKAEELGLKKAQKNKVLVETRKLGTEAQKAVLELEAFKLSGGVDPSKKFDQEKKLRDEYVKRSGNFSAATDAFAKIDVSSKDNSGAGDIALVTSFMKMLDPGSVVRETEFATAQNTEGLLGQLQNAAQKAQTGQFLTPKQRQDFSRLARKYMDAAEKENRGIIKDLSKVVTNYNLTSENIFGDTNEPELESRTVAKEQIPAGKSYLIHAKVK